MFLTSDPDQTLALRQVVEMLRVNNQLLSKMLTALERLNGVSEGSDLLGGSGSRNRKQAGKRREHWSDKRIRW